MFQKKLKSLCMPSMVYLVMSVIGLLYTLVYNMSYAGRVYNIGDMFSFVVPSVFLVYLVKIMYIALWTYVLDLICKDGHKTLSWILVALPFVFIFMFMGELAINS